MNAKRSRLGSEDSFSASLSSAYWRLIWPMWSRLHGFIVQVNCANILCQHSLEMIVIRLWALHPFTSSFFSFNNSLIFILKLCNWIIKISSFSINSISRIIREFDRKKTFEHSSSTTMPLSTSSRVSEPLYLELPETPTKIDATFSTYERAKMFQELGIFYENLLKTTQPITPASPFDQQTNMFTYGPLMQNIKPRNPFSIESILGFQNSTPSQPEAGFYGQTMMDFSSPPRIFEASQQQPNMSAIRSSFLAATPQSVCSSYSSPTSSTASSPIKSQGKISCLLYCFSFLSFYLCSSFIICLLFFPFFLSFRAFYLV